MDRVEAMIQPARQPAALAHRRLSWLLGGLLVLALVLSVLVGRYPSPPAMSPARLLTDQLAQRLVVNLRLARILTAALLGMALGASGTVLQMIFRNPLVEPGFLGVSQGAAFGAALSILFLSASPFLVEVNATLFACLGMAASYFLARRIRYGGWILRLVLAGIAVSALFSAGLGVLKYLADPLTELPNIVFWMLGGLWGVTWSEVLYLLPLVVPGLVIVYLLRWRLNLLSLGDETAFSLGAAPERERALILVAAVAATAAVVSVAGIVGWVGLIVPHIARRLYGADARRAVPAAMAIGAIFVLVCDALARTLIASEVPLGILASLLGALLFIVLMATNAIPVQR
jgi:iron complex transport system permease protein